MRPQGGGGLYNAFVGRCITSLIDAYEDALGRGPSWRSRIEASLRRLPESAKTLNELVQ